MGLWAAGSHAGLYGGAYEDQSVACISRGQTQQCMRVGRDGGGRYSRDRNGEATDGMGDEERRPGRALAWMRGRELAHKKSPAFDLLVILKSLLLKA
jgi:hypothetical protein